MADKLLKYDVAIKSTKTVWQMDTPRCYTGDENTVTFDFNITDLEEADLVGVIPNVYLYMRDGSFFQNGPDDGVEITGTKVNYTMKGNEGKHSGIAKAQLVLVWDDGINPAEKLTSQLYVFEVVSGLENKVAVEVMIQDWTTLTREARTFIDTSADEVDALKGELQTAINTANVSLGEFDIALQNGIVATNIAAELQNLEETYAPDIVAVKQQLSDKADLSDLPSSAYVFKGSTTFAALPTTLNTLGDVYYTTDNLVNYAWTGTAWAPIGNGAFADGSVVTKKLADRSVTADKTTFLGKVYGKNYFDKTNVILDMFGTSVLAGYYTTNQKILLEANETYTIRYVRQWKLYEMDGTTQYLMENLGINTAIKTLTMPARPMLLEISGQTVNLNGTQIEKGSAFTSYEAYAAPKITFDGMTLTDAQILSTKKATGELTITKSGELFKLYGQFDSTQDIQIETIRNGSLNGSFNFANTYVDGTLIHSGNDDITPIRTFTTVGGNHGYTSIVVITMANHGKTSVDLGSKWSDGVTVYTLLKISGNNLTFGCPYTVTNDIVSANSITPVANLIHVSGATNISLVDVTTKISGSQLYPSINKISVKYLLDGKEITEDGTYYGDEVQVVEHYTIMDYKAIIDFAQANIGVNYANETIGGAVEISNVFTFTKGLKCTTSHTFRALKKLSVQNCGFLQSVALAPLSSHTRKRFVPNVLPKNGYDFANGIDLDAYSTNINIYAASLVNPTIPPSHYVDWIYDSLGNKKYGFSMGYVVDKTNSKHSDRLVNIPSNQLYWDLRDSKKSYPVAMNGVTFQPNEYRNFMGFRNYLSPEEVGDATLLNVVKDKKDTYLYALYNHQVTLENKEFPEEIGNSIAVIQNENMTVVNNVIDANGAVITTSAVLSNGILKIN